ncbi:hypothetical protein BpHYR1_001180 [Brachionus plicatilis]|uniref:Uncharacterized protein n=1 Tax=Brachionus plicatilis TaxID=10195 RepID=A0A3M7SMY7_BRAPC|nr:hypothetical protein BpHYR1_001180 [Brachionus plicatilis]
MPLKRDSINRMDRSTKDGIFFVVLTCQEILEHPVFPEQLLGTDKQINKKIKKCCCVCCEERACCDELIKQTREY